MIIELIQLLRDNRTTVVRISYLLLALTVLWGALVDKHHAHTWVEQHIPGFWSLFGFVACVLIIIISKWFGHQGIMTREDYYDK